MSDIPDSIAMAIARDCVCSRCWGDLTLFADQETRWRIECQTCGENNGYVSRAYAGARWQENAAEAVEVKELLRKLNVIGNANKLSADQILKELGF